MHLNKTETVHYTQFIIHLNKIQVEFVIHPWESHLNWFVPCTGLGKINASSADHISDLFSVGS